MADKVITFGHSIRKDFLLDPDYVAMNHGSYGLSPRSIHQLRQDYLNKAEENPDRFNRLEAPALLRKNRERIAEFLQADPDNVVFVQNASSGLSTVFRSFPFDKGDKVLCVSVCVSLKKRPKG